MHPVIVSFKKQLSEMLLLFQGAAARQLRAPRRSAAVRPKSLTSWKPSPLVPLPVRLWMTHRTRPAAVLPIQVELRLLRTFLFLSWVGGTVASIRPPVRPSTQSLVSGSDVLISAMSGRHKSHNLCAGVCVCVSACLRKCM